MLTFSRRQASSAIGLLALLFAAIISVDASRWGSLRFLPRLGQPRNKSCDNVAFILKSKSSWLHVRGGDQEEVLTLDEKVKRAMHKLGLGEPPNNESELNQQQEQPTTTTATCKEGECQDGVCPMPEQSSSSTASTTQATTTTQAAATTTETISPEQQQLDIDVDILAEKIAEEMNVHPSLAMAALGATSSFETADPKSRTYNEAQARSMIQQELDIIATVAEDSKEVQQLVSEGYDTFLARRALAFSDQNMDDARAILLADKLDEEEEEEQQRNIQSAASTATEQEEEEMKTVTVDANFDPTSIGMKSSSTPAAPAPAPEMPKPARKEDVVFEATTAQIQELVIESPVPVLLDIHAEWCGPCKVLGPVLEDMAVKAGGIFRLVKVNSDNERPVSTALEITALPTVFGIKDGKIQHMFQGMPKSEEFMRNFMMGLMMPGGKFDPPVTTQEKEKYEELSKKLAKTAGAASFSFSAREVLQDRISTKLDALVEARNGDLVETEASVQILRSLLSNVIRNPYDAKFRKINLANKVLAQKVAHFKPCISILKSVGFTQENSETLIIGKGKKIVNVAPLTVARDYLDDWIDKTRYDVAKAARKKRDEQALKELEEQGALDSDDEEEEEEEEEVDPNRCTLKVRLEGKKKVHELILHADDSLSKVVDSLSISKEPDEELQITCVAKRLVVKSTDAKAMEKSLRDYGLLPAAAIVVKIGAGTKNETASKGKLAERAAAEKKKKKGSHTMQSIGVYAKDDNAKGELIDGGGGVWYEHDVSDDEEEDVKDDAEESGEDASDAKEDDQETGDEDEQ